MEMRIELILAAAIVHMVVGALWYSPAFFGTLWQRLVKKNDRELHKSAAGAYRMAMIGAIISAYVLARILSVSPPVSLANSLNTVFWMWTGIIMPALLINNTFAQRPFLLSLVDGTYHLVALMAAAAVLSVGL